MLMEPNLICQHACRRMQDSQRALSLVTSRLPALHFHAPGSTPGRPEGVSAWAVMGMPSVMYMACLWSVRNMLGCKWPGNITEARLLKKWGESPRKLSPGPCMNPPSMAASRSCRMEALRWVSDLCVGGWGVGWRA